MEVRKMDRNKFKSDHVVLDDEEKAIEEALERGEFEETMSRVQAQADWKKVLVNARRKSPVTVRLDEETIDMLKVRALRDGMPYQTLVNSILHKYVHGRLKERD
jgi:predicted DNA binding CopG/RHH family protein